MFDLKIACSDKSLDTLKKSYHDFWYKYDNTLEIETIYKIWFYKNNNNNNIIKCRVYYKINKIAPPDHGSSQFYNVIFLYNTNINEYKYIYPSENMKKAYYNDCGLTINELKELVLFFPRSASETNIQKIIFNTIPINRKLLLEQDIEVNQKQLELELIQYIESDCNKLVYKNNGLKLYNWNFLPIIQCLEQKKHKATLPLANFNKFKWFYNEKFTKICKYTHSILEDIKKKYKLISEYYDVFYSKLLKNTIIPDHIDKNTSEFGDTENFFSNDHVFGPFMEINGAVRLHIPIITHENIYFNIYDKYDKKYTYNFKTGKIYFVRAVDRLHGVNNKSNIDRYHIVIDAKPSEKLLSLID